MPSLSARTIVYKGLLLAPQIAKFYSELSDPDVTSALCLVHQRFSTNTFPTWQLAHPFRYVAHNGEINTVRGNVNWMHARQSDARIAAVRRRYQEALPDHPAGRQRFGRVRQCARTAGAVRPLAAARHGDADSRSVGRQPAHGCREKKAFYEYHCSLMEPWDGPAAIAFTDGRVIGATLDRNGLRPARYLVTHDDLVVMASETGVLPIKPEDVKMKGRLQPGKMFLVDLEQGRIVSDKEIKEQLASRQPYGDGSRKTRSRSTSCPSRRACTAPITTPSLHAAARLRLHRRRPALPDDADGGRTAKSRSARWAPIRRWPAFPTSRSRCSTTSSSCSRRSPIRRSIPSAKRW